MDITTDLLIAGQLRAGGEAPRPVENPATGEVLAHVNDASTADVDEALHAASKAWREWAEVPEPERAVALRRLADLVASAAPDLAQVLVAELGKPMRQAEEELLGTVGFLTHAASLLETRHDEVRYTAHQGEEIWLRRRPHGVVAAIIPWNFPSALVTRKLGPALAAGNAIVLKVDEKTPLSALALGKILADSGLFPEGLVSIVTGEGERVGRQLVRSELTHLVTMTGSTEAGKSILRDAAELVKPVTLELGGKAPFIVMADADLEGAVSDAVSSRHLNCGQVCIANERTFVQRAVYDEFVERYVSATEALVVGNPVELSTDVGPKVSREELDKTLQAIAGAEAAGARVLTGGGRASVGGFPAGNWVAPTVLSDVDDSMRVMVDEVFGPVTPIAPFDTYDEVLERANASRYGLSAYVYTRDLRTAMRVTEDLSFGEVYINRAGPEEINGFHAGFRESGLGGDDGAHGLESYFRKQTVYLRY